MAQKQDLRSVNLLDAVAKRFKRLSLGLQTHLQWPITGSGSFHRRFEEAVTNMSQGVCLYDSHDRLRLANDQFCNIYRQPMANLRMGMTFREVLTESIAVGNYPGRSVEEVWQDRKAFIDQRQSGTFLQQLGDGRLIAILHQPLADGGWLATYEDITERRRAENQVKFMAQHDSLTRLPNRLLFAERLEAAMQAAAHGRSSALICLDLDGFKLVNDRLGHAAGDTLLRQVADRLQACLRGADTAARLGGDEFAVLLPDTASPQAQAIADRIGAELRREFDLDMFGPAHVGVSIGIAYAPEQASAADALLSYADKALYVAKHARRVSPHAPETRSSSPPARLGPTGIPRDGLGAPARRRRHGQRPARRAAIRRGAPGIPGDLRLPLHQPGGLRGAAPLGRPHPRHRPPGRLHPRRRGKRLHRRPHRMGPAPRLHRCCRLEQRCVRHGEPLAAELQPAQPGVGHPPASSPRPGWRQTG